MVRVKICGITNRSDALMAVKLGADAIGFVFAPSPRRVTPEDVRDLVDGLPPLIQTVGVFVDEDPGTIRRIIDFCGLDLVQLHGDEPPDLCRELMPCVIKAFRLKDASSLSPLPSYRDRVRAFLFDTHSERKKGGTGKSFDWSLALKGKEWGVPVILSGGLGPSNVEEAISTVRPFAVDLNSGIEAQPGKKDPALMKQLMAGIHRINTTGVTDD